jgi:hypothetical protein
MKYLSTFLIVVVVVALVFGFAANLTSLAPQMPKLEAADGAKKTQPQVAEKKVHHRHHQPALASMGFPAPAEAPAAADDGVGAAAAAAATDPESLSAPEPDAGSDSQSSMDNIPME